MITGFRMEWRFDAMTSAYMLDGEDMSPENAADTLHQMSSAIMDNMLYEHYFTYFYDGETPIKYKVAENNKMEQERSRLVLSFDIPLSKPMPVTKDSLRLLVFDPSYYVDMAWKAQGDVVLSEALSNQCTLEVVEPNPTPEQMSYAMSLPADADPDNTLGQLFTQSVELTCQPNNES